MSALLDTGPPPDQGALATANREERRKHTKPAANQRFENTQGSRPQQIIRTRRPLGGTHHVG